MHAQIVYFDGPRRPELVAAAERAGRDRVTPAVLADPDVAAGHVATFVLRTPEGGDIVLVVAESEALLARANEIIASTPLLPDEDPALLPGPDRVEHYEVIHAVERGRVTDPTPTG